MAWYRALTCVVAVAQAATVAVAVEPHDAVFQAPRRGAATLIHPVEYGEPSTMQSIGSSFQRGMDTIASPFKSKPQDEPSKDPTSLSTPARNGSSLPLAMARHHEEQGNPAEAAKSYQQAIKLAPRDPRPLACYAHFKAVQGELPEAVDLYQKALRLAPDDPSILNDLGLCYARAKMFNEAATSIGRAAQVQPKNALYRNNLAMVLVDLGQVDNAFTHLAAVHPPAVAHYNLGYLLNQKNQVPLAVQHFSFALQMDPSLTQAQYWLQRLDAAPPPAAPLTPPPQWAGPTPPASNDARMNNTRPEAAPLPPSTPNLPQPAVPAAVSGPPIYRVEQKLVVLPAPQQPTPPAVQAPAPQPIAVATPSKDKDSAPPAPQPAVSSRPSVKPLNLQLLPPANSTADPQAPLPPPSRSGLQRLPQP